MLSPVTFTDKMLPFSGPGSDKGTLTSSQVNHVKAMAICGALQRSDELHPTNWPSWQRWSIVIIYCMLQTYVTLTQTMYLSAEDLIVSKWRASKQVVTLGQSLFVIGNAIGPAFLGPLSDLGGRKWVYVASTAVYATLNIGCAYALNLPMLIIFMFLIGVTGSASLTNIAGTIVDLFGDDIAGNGQAMALFVFSAELGPGLGSPVGCWITDNLGLKWIFLINVTIGAVFTFFLCFVPETLPRYAIANSGAKKNVIAKTEVETLRLHISLVEELKFIATTTFKIITQERIVLCLGLYNGFAFGLLFLYFDGVFEVFTTNNHLSVTSSSLTYLNFVVGAAIMFCFFPVQNWCYQRDRKRNGGRGRPEAHFYTSLYAVWLFPIALFWLAFTSNGKTSVWSPIMAGAVLGFVNPLIWLSMLNYVMDTYPFITASAVAAMMIPSNILAGVFSHVGIIMFKNLSSTMAMSVLGGISCPLIALIYYIYFKGEHIRNNSKISRHPPRDQACA